MERNNYQWQGEKVKVEFGLCKVIEVKNKPLWWWNYECCWDDYYNKDKYSMHDKSALVPAVKITHKEQEFVIANHFGIGVHKLINGGHPNYRHYSLPLDGFESTSCMTIQEQYIYVHRKFDLLSFEDHEAKRSKWQKRKFPKEVSDRKLKFWI